MRSRRRVGVGQDAVDAGRGDGDVAVDGDDDRGPDSGGSDRGEAVRNGVSGGTGALVGDEAREQGLEQRALGGVEAARVVVQKLGRAADGADQGRAGGGDDGAVEKVVRGALEPDGDGAKCCGVGGRGKGEVEADARFNELGMGVDDVGAGDFAGVAPGREVVAGDAQGEASGGCVGREQPAGAALGGEDFEAAEKAEFGGDSGEDVLADRAGERDGTAAEASLVQRNAKARGSEERVLGTGDGRRARCRRPGRREGGR